MFNVKAEPVANDPPYKRIEIGAIEPESGEPNAAPHIRSISELLEAERIWSLVHQAASGTNPPPPPPPSDESSRAWEINSEGWDAA